MKYLAFSACLFIGLTSTTVHKQVMYSIRLRQAIIAAQQEARSVDKVEKPKIAIPTEYVVVPISKEVSVAETVAR